MELLLTKKDILIKLLNKTLTDQVTSAWNAGDMKQLQTDDPVLNLLVDDMVKYKKPSKQQIVFLTITKNNDQSVCEFVDNIKKLTSYRLTSEKPQYCFESTVINDGNVHCHYLCMKQIGINKQQYIRRLEKILSCFNINVQIYKSDYYQDKVSYMQGQKDSDQGDKTQITEDFRKRHGLASLY